MPAGPVSHDRAIVGNGHCSILVRPIGDSFAPSDIIFGHTTWDPYTLMLRITKHYDFAYANVASRHAVFSSFPAVLYSFDDWYTLDSGLSVSETTIINLNPELWSRIVPQSVPDWTRNMVANRLATSGAGGRGKSIRSLITLPQCVHIRGFGFGSHIPVLSITLF